MTLAISEAQEQFLEARISQSVKRVRPPTWRRQSVVLSMAIGRQCHVTVMLAAGERCINSEMHRDANRVTGWQGTVTVNQEMENM